LKDIPMLDHNRPRNGGPIVPHPIFKMLNGVQSRSQASSRLASQVGTLGGPEVTAEYQFHDRLNGCFVVNLVRQEPGPSERHEEYQCRIRIDIRREFAICDS
jgi:hypothetical protein